MFLKHLILASTLALSWPSIALSSSSVSPEKFCGGRGGGMLKGGGMGMKNGGGNGKLAAAAAAVAVVADVPKNKNV